MGRITEIMADMEKVEKGQWVPFAAGIRLCIANINNAKYRQARKAILGKHLRSTRARKLEPDDVLDLLKPAVARHILVGWENLQDEAGCTIDYSPEKALEFFENPALRELYIFVVETAGEAEWFRQEQFEDSVKNLETASGGS